MPRGKIYNLVRVEDPDGSGSVLFSRRHAARYRGRLVLRSPFFMWPDVRRVELLVRNNLMGSEHVA